MGKTMNAFVNERLGLTSYADYRQQENMRDYSFYFKKYKNLICSLFRWENLPDGISARFIEDKLFQNGVVIFFRPKSMNQDFFVVSQAVQTGLNEYEEPSGFRAYSNGKINENVTLEECVPIWNNMFYQPNVQDVQFFAKRMSNIQKTFDVNLEQLKLPTIITCPEEQKESAKAFFTKKTNAEPVIYLSKDFSNDIEINNIDLRITNYTEDLQKVLKTCDNDALTFFGINNVNILKNERLTKAEGVQNDEQININKNSMLVARQIACEQINEKFGLDVQVKLNTDYENILFNEGIDIDGRE